MYFSKLDLTIGQTDTADSFPFAPTAATIDLAETGDLANARTRCNRFDIENFAHNLECHPRIVVGILFPSRCAFEHRMAQDGLSAGAQRRSETHRRSQLQAMEGWVSLRSTHPTAAGGVITPSKPLFRLASPQNPAISRPISHGSMA
jgi:hypothetical protein